MQSVVIVVGTDAHSPVAHRGSEGAWSKKFSCSTSDLHSDERDSNIRDPGEHEDRSIQRPSDTAPERTSGGDQDGGEFHDLVQSGRSGGEFWCSGYTTIHIDRYY